MTIYGLPPSTLRMISRQFGHELQERAYITSEVRIDDHIHEFDGEFQPILRLDVADLGRVCFNIVVTCSNCRGDDKQGNRKRCMIDSQLKRHRQWIDRAHLQLPKVRHTTINLHFDTASGHSACRRDSRHKYKTISTVPTLQALDVYAVDLGHVLTESQYDYSKNKERLLEWVSETGEMKDVYESGTANNS